MADRHGSGLFRKSRHVLTTARALWRKNAKNSHPGSRVSIEVYLQRHHERKSTRMVQSESIQAICIPRVHQPFRKINYYDTTFRRSSLVTAHTIEAKLRTCLFSTAHKLSFTTQRWPSCNETILRLPLKFLVKNLFETWTRLCQRSCSYFVMSHTVEAKLCNLLPLRTNSVWASRDHRPATPVPSSW